MAYRLKTVLDRLQLLAFHIYLFCLLSYNQEKASKTQKFFREVIIQINLITKREMFFWRKFDSICKIQTKM